MAKSERNRTKRGSKKASLKRDPQIQPSHLVDSEEIFRKVFEEGPFGMALVNPDFTFGRVNRALCAMLGFSEQQLAKLKFTDITYPDDLDIGVQLSRKLFQGEIPHFTIEKRYVKRNGEIVSARLTASLLHDETGKPIQSVAVIEDISEHKRAQEALQLSEEKYRYLYEGSPAFKMIIGIDGKVKEANSTVVETLGYSKAEIVGRDVLDFVVKEQRDYVASRLSKALEDEETPEIAVDAYAKDGFIRTILFARGQLALKENGRINSIFLSGTDITERRKMEAQVKKYSEHLEQLVLEKTEELRASEERYRTLAERSFDVILTTDANGRITYASPAVERIWGYKPSELLGKLSDGLYPPEEAHKAQQSFQLLLKGETIEGFPVQAVRRDGLQLSIEINAAPIIKDGEVVGTQSIIRDITDRKQREEEAHRQADQLAALDATVLEITQSHDLPRLLKTLVERAAHLLGANAGEMYLCDPEREEVRSVVSYNTPKDYTGVVLKYGEGAAGKVAKTGQSLVIADYGKWEGRSMIFEKDLPFGAVLMAPLIWQNQVIGTIDVMDDSSRRIFTNDDLKLLTRFANHAAIAVENARLFERLLRAERLAAIGETAAMVGHDLRNPLQGIAGAVFLLSDQPARTEEEKRLLEMIESSVDYSNRIINDLLDYSGEMRVRLVETTVKALVADSLSTLKIPANVVVEDSALDEPTIGVDRDKMRRALVNIVKNAFDAMPQGGRLKIGSAQLDDKITISFSDTGVGMPEQVMQNLWKPLQTTKAKGLGLGLAICKRIIDAHDGSISVESVQGSGTTITITLRAKPNSQREA